MNNIFHISAGEASPGCCGGLVSSREVRYIQCSSLAHMKCDLSRLVSASVIRISKDNLLNRHRLCLAVRARNNLSYYLNHSDCVACVPYIMLFSC